MGLFWTFMCFFSIVLFFIIFVFKDRILYHLGNKDVEAQEEKLTTSVKAPPRNPYGRVAFDPDSVVTFEKEAYAELFKHYQTHTVKPKTDPYSFNQVSRELHQRFLQATLLNPLKSLDQSYSYSFTVNPRVKGTSQDDWSKYLSMYSHFKKQPCTALSDYIYYLCSLNAIALTGKLIFKDSSILEPQSGYSSAMTIISRNCGSDNYHNDKYGPAILFYYTVHLLTVTKILENQKRLSEEGSAASVYLKYLEDELGLTRLDLDKETKDYIKPVGVPIQSVSLPHHLAREFHVG